ncbi:MAG: amidohydrolase family protein [Hungatella sp.]|nr:amidohydrolase family protein [Hungatella sp.]
MRHILIKKGLIYDGSGNMPFQGDILIEGEKIIKIAPDIEKEDAQMIDASGKAVTPGFIDIHRHCDITPFTNPHFGEIELAQGITTTFVGNCGLAPVPSVPSWRKELYDYLEPVIGRLPETMAFETYEAYRNALEAIDLPVNMGFFAASDSIKVALKGFGSKPYTEEELIKAQEYVKSALAQGAFGITLGIMYQPECYSSREELTAVVKAIAGNGGILCTHIRGEGASLVESVEEVIDVAAKAGVPLHISHLKSTGIKNWNRKIFEAIHRIEQARESGQDVTADFYPYDGGSTTLQSLLPPTIMEESFEALVKSLSGPDGKKRLRSELNKAHQGWDNMSESIGWDRIIISSVTLEKNGFMQGQTIDALAKKLGYEEPSDLVADLLAEENGKVGIIVLSMSQEDVDAVARLPFTLLISDSLYGGNGKNAHPRLLGTTARFINDFVLKRNVLSMELAVSKMTDLPAKRMGLEGRGLLRPGYQADVLVFQPERFLDHADYTGKHDQCTGMDLVFMGGRQVLADGILLDRAGGKLLRKGFKPDTTQ